MLKKHFALALLLAGSLFVAACDKDDDDTATPTPAPTLYERLGKVDGITAVVDQFVGNVVAETSTPSSKLKRTFQPLLDDVAAGRDARLRLLKQNLIDQIGSAAGGPLVYKGKTMTEAHKNMRITDEEFTVLVAQLQAALVTKNVPTAEQNELLGVLGGLKGSIVNQ